MFAKTGSPQANEALVVRVSSDLPFDDILGHTFADDIVWAFEQGIANGCSADPPLFCPDSTVTRGQMATFLDRALDLPDATDDYFTDDEASSARGSDQPGPRGGDRLRMRHEQVLPELTGDA